MIIEITMSELANRVNYLLRNGGVGEEFSFAENFDCGCGEYDVKHCHEYNETDVEGWHCATKINATEVVIRYMGGVCFGITTDTNVDADDMHQYMLSASNYGWSSEEKPVYMEL